ncbi:acetyl esterase [Aliiroseovarius halocynthiae]|uniref:Alpha/beta hydrolase n=1 Tax=Aliiroseovarius halocynthiae TaxID=985055 RepID=A0A545SNV7_9RHOB|nr:alpha/beta hydrolase [Aliiroseovarius halocynthiae]TQV66655.1 alpha/beta hydrolase [Aliiroseovarius halocynthiae]SMR82468.1 acetyl esterase [Aliiroseovarius halocynthiae]
MDYSKLIDDEIWRFIRETDAHYPPDAVNRTVAEQRQVYDTMCRAFFAGYPDGLNVRDDAIDGIPIRLYEPAKPKGTVVYFHGGGFVVGGLDSHDDVCAEISDQTGLRVVSVDYRLCPEHPHPAAFEDAVTAVLYASQVWDEPLVLAGDSAGGNLTAAVCHTLRGSVQIAGQVLIYPGLGGDMTKGSYIDHANAPMLTMDDLKFYSAIRFETPPNAPDPTAAPLEDTDFSDLPPTVSITAQCDPLADDGMTYRDAILAAGGKAVWFNEAGLVHGYLRARHQSDRARRSFARIVDQITMLAQGEWHH